MAHKITFNNAINVSASAGDELISFNVTNGVISPTPILYGTISSISEKSITVDNPLQSLPSPPFYSYFFCFRKSNINNAGIKGYYAEAKMSTIADTSNVNHIGLDKKTELYAVGSEISLSSK
tara:strand:+ start:196 stop:561 length:366 start_codon:yes stop_codon:yes gene_type:complete